MISGRFISTKLIAKNKLYGLTLIELLIVVLIISIATGLVFYQFSPINSQQKTSKTEADRLIQLCKQISNKALFNNSAYGLSIDEDGYYWWQLDYTNQQWKIIEKKPFIDYRTDNNHYTLEFKDEKSASKINDYTPHIIFYPDLTITPFRCFIIIDSKSAEEIIISTDGVSDVQIES